MKAASSTSYRYDFSPSPCGGLRLTLASVQTQLRTSGALWLPTQGALVCADLHLEKGSAYAARVQLLPPYDTRETVRRLEVEVDALAPETIVLLGDTFHDAGSEQRLDEGDADCLRRLAVGRTLVWVVGNHDADGPRHLPGEVVNDIDIAGLRLRHEPQAGRSPCEVSGHLHPAARVRSPRGSVRRRCFVTDGERMILPAFGAFAGGLNVRDAAFADLFVRPPIVGALGSKAVHAVGWRSLAGD